MTRTELNGAVDHTLEELQQRLQISIDPALLQLALTHRSFAYENGGIPTNERLEFLGDSILGQAVTVKLFRDHPDLDEGSSRSGGRASSRVWRLPRSVARSASVGSSDSAGARP